MPRNHPTPWIALPADGADLIDGAGMWFFNAADGEEVFYGQAMSIEVRDRVLAAVNGVPDSCEAKEGQSAAQLPQELNDDLLAILGRPNFACAKIAEVLRLDGATIATKAEHEQAATIHFLLMAYLNHGSEWEKRANDALSEKLAGACSAMSADAGKEET